MVEYYVIEVGRIAREDEFYHSFGPFATLTECAEKIESLRRREVDWFTTIPFFND